VNNACGNEQPQKSTNKSPEGRNDSHYEVIMGRFHSLSIGRNEFWLHTKIHFNFELDQEMSHHFLNSLFKHYEDEDRKTSTLWL